MTKLSRATLVVASALLLVQRLHAQVTARQGTRSEEANEFQSPMILEVPFVANTPSHWTGNWISGKDYVGLRKFRCERLFLDSLQLSAKKAGEERINVRIKTAVQNPDGSHDKTVKLKFDVYNEDKNIGSAEVEAFKVEESDRKTRTASLFLPITELKADPAPKLKITVSVWDK